MLLYHTTTTSALQAVARLARTSPYVVVIVAPLKKAEQVAQRQAQRYPSITATHTTRTALRRAGYPAVQLVVMHPSQGEVVMLLMSQHLIEGREVWQHALDPDTPLVWRHYQLTTTPEGRITWRLSEATRRRYEVQIARLITGRGGVRIGANGRKRAAYQLPPESAHRQVMKLAEHLRVYPGLAGVRADLFALAQYSTRVWNSTHPKHPYPRWPTYPYLPYLQPRTAPLHTITQHPPEEPHHDPEEETSSNPQP